MKLLFGERSGEVGPGMRAVSVLLGAVAEAGVSSKATFAKLVHLYFSNIYMIPFFNNFNVTLLTPEVTPEVTSLRRYALLLC